MDNSRVAVEADLGRSPKRLVAAADAAGWVSVATVSSREWSGVPWTLPTIDLVVRGKRGPQRFVVRWRDGAVDRCYWWTRDRTAVIKGYRYKDVTTKVNAYSVNVSRKPVHDPELDEVVTWELPKPAPLAVTITDLIGVGGKHPRPGLIGYPHQ